MKPTNWRLLPKVVSGTFSVAFLIVGGLCQESASASPSASDPLTIQLSLANGNRLSLGEPISLRYDVTNNSQQNFTAYVGLDGVVGGMQWLTTTISDKEGRMIAPLPETGPSEHEGQQGDRFLVGAGKTQYGYVVLNQKFLLPHPGDYSLVVSARLPYDVEAPPIKYLPGQDVPFELPPASLTGEQFSFTLHVTPEDPPKLQALAATLRRDATTETNVMKVDMLIESLFSLPEAQASQEWQTIATDPALFPSTQFTVIKQLRRINSLKAADILAQGLWTSPAHANAATKTSMNEALHSMYVCGNTKIKQHIRSLYVAHGVSDARVLDGITVSRPN